MSGVDVPEDEVKVLHHLLEVLLFVLELFGAHVPAEDVQGAVRQELLGLHGLAQGLVELQPRRGTLLACVTALEASLEETTRKNFDLK